ncbi:hypothetical protein, partial [Pseudomonas aeruginosa]|uniref:hypothetical protein n=1 Tax=Pseudomonas aeruginosa TaxID=287 RepID=UPI001C896528
LEGLSILRMKSCRIIIEVVDEHGEILTVEETIRIVEKKRLEKPRLRSTVTSGPLIPALRLSPMG